MDDCEDLSADGPSNSRNLVDEIFNRMQALQNDNERLFLENRNLKEENARLRGANSARFDINSKEARDRLSQLLAHAHANATAAED